MHSAAVSAAILRSYEGCPARAGIQSGNVRQAGTKSGFSQKRSTEPVKNKSGRIAHSMAAEHFLGRPTLAVAGTLPESLAAFRAYKRSLNILEGLRGRALHVERLFQLETQGQPVRVAKPDLVARNAAGTGLEIVEIKTHQNFSGWPRPGDRTLTQLVFFADVVSECLDAEVTHLSVLGMAYNQYFSVPYGDAQVASTRRHIRQVEGALTAAKAESRWPTRPSPEACGDCPISGTCKDSVATPVAIGAA